MISLDWFTKDIPSELRPADTLGRRQSGAAPAEGRLRHAAGDRRHDHHHRRWPRVIADPARHPRRRLPERVRRSEPAGPRHPLLHRRHDRRAVGRHGHLHLHDLGRATSASTGAAAFAGALALGVPDAADRRALHRGDAPARARLRCARRSAALGTPQVEDDDRCRAARPRCPASRQRLHARHRPRRRRDRPAAVHDRLVTDDAPVAVRAEHDARPRRSSPTPPNPAASRWPGARRSR